MKKLTVAINGFGRIGRLFFRAAWGRDDMEVVAVNDLGSAESLAYLLKYDTVYRRFSGSVTSDGSHLIVDGKRIAFFQEKDPAKLPWGKLGIDIVVESTGAFDSYEGASAHLRAGAKRVVISAPAKDADSTEHKTMLMGVNDDGLEGVTITSNGSCTTNAAAPLIAILSETLGIERALLNTVHAYTATQSSVDSPAEKPDRGRAAAQNIVPSTTGAALAVARALTELQGKFDGISLRVPVIAGSIADVTFISKRDTSVEEVNGILKRAAREKRWEGIFTVTEDPIVSSDVIGEPYAAIADLSYTKVVGNLVKVLSWYDNEWGYAEILTKHVLAVGNAL